MTRSWQQIGRHGPQACPHCSHWCAVCRFRMLPEKPPWRDTHTPCCECLWRRVVEALLLGGMWLGFFTARVPGEAEHPEVAEALGLVWRPVASCTRLAARSPVATWGDNRGPRIAGAPRKTRTLRQKQRTQVGHQRGWGAPLGGGPPSGKTP